MGSVLDNRIFIAGGHGMWGMKQGPATGRLLAEQITTADNRQACANSTRWLAGSYERLRPVVISDFEGCRAWCDFDGHNFWGYGGAW